MRKSSPPEGLKSHPLIEKLISGGAQPGGQDMIVGYIGPSQDDERVRVYLDLTLSSYCEIAVSDVVATASVDSQRESSPSIIWLKLGAKIDRVDTTRSMTVLSGQIQQTYLQQALRYYAAGVRNRPLTPLDTTAEDSFFVCATALCPKPSDSCPSTGWACASNPPTCRPDPSIFQCPPKAQ
jgi:hypothetical protein